jgi:uncharacterized membrane protein (GlpM family)
MNNELRISILFSVIVVYNFIIFFIKIYNFVVNMLFKSD